MENKSPGHDELRCALYLINGTVMDDHFREQVLSTPLGTVRSSWLSGADLGGHSKQGSSSWCGKVGARCCAPKPQASFPRPLRQPTRLLVAGTLRRSIARPRQREPTYWLRR